MVDAIFYNLTGLEKEILSSILKNYNISSTDIIKDEECKIVICGFNAELSKEEIGWLRFKLRYPAFIASMERVNATYLNQILEIGFVDYIAKPYSEQDVYFKVKKSMNISKAIKRIPHLENIFEEKLRNLEKQRHILVQRLDKNTENLNKMYADLHHTYLQAIKALAQALDYRDHYTHSHSQNVARISREIALEMALPLDQVRIIEEAGYLHDIGKISIDDAILKKPEKLTPEEWESVKQHPLNGAKILEPLDFLGEAVDIVRQHHEHFDGSGYPAGLKGEQITLGARILHLADAYDAMRSERPYRQIPLSKKEVVDRIRKLKGIQFDPHVVDFFLKIVDRID